MYQKGYVEWLRYLTAVLEFWVDQGVVSLADSGRVNWRKSREAIIFVTHPSSPEYSDTLRPWAWPTATVVGLHVVEPAPHCLEFGRKAKVV